MRQDVPQKGVVAEPDRFRAEPDDEVVVVLHPFEHALRVVLSGDRVGQPGTGPLTDARLQQELPLLRRPFGQDLVGQVVVDAADVTGEVGDRSPTVAAGDEAGSEIQAGSPPFGSLEQQAHLRRGETESMPLTQSGCFRCGERQVLGPDLGDLPGRAEALQRQRRLHAADEDDAQRRRRAPQQVAQLPQDLRIMYFLKIVDDQHRSVR
jgi:hypothetical protein